MARSMPTSLPGAPCQKDTPPRSSQPNSYQLGTPWRGKALTATAARRSIDVPGSSRQLDGPRKRPIPSRGASSLPGRLGAGLRGMTERARQEFQPVTFGSVDRLRFAVNPLHRAVLCLSRCNSRSTISTSPELEWRARSVRGVYRKGWGCLRPARSLLSGFAFCRRLCGVTSRGCIPCRPLRILFCAAVPAQAVPSPSRLREPGLDVRELALERFVLPLE